MKNLLRARTVFLVIGVILAILMSYLSDPSGGKRTFFAGLELLLVIVAVALAHWCRKKLFDYPEGDLQKLAGAASQNPVGAGLVFVGICGVFCALLFAFAPRANASVLPAGFYKHIDALVAEQKRYWPDHPDIAYLAALVEQESCTSLKSKKCWNPAARLKATRKDGSEEGAGMGQLTRVYRADGSLRFDSLKAMRAQYGPALGDLSWDNVYQRPDLQLRTMVIMSRDAANLRQFSDLSSLVKLAFGDAIYNGGPRDLQRERRACGMVKSCDPNQWFGHVENVCLKSRKPLYGGKNACDINREHVRNVMLVRSNKYRQFFKNQISTS